MTDDIFVQIMDLPTKTKEAVTQNDDGSYTIFINAKLNHENQLLAYEHAIRHISSHDFEKVNVQQIEYVAHNPVSSPIIKTYRNDQFIKRIRAEHLKTKKKMQEYEARRLYLESIGVRYEPTFISGLDNY